MNKDKAREILEEWIDSKTEDNISMRLPYVDEVVITIQSNNKTSQYTFKGLIKIAYEL